MNPKYNPETAAAAENAVAEQTQRTVEQIEQNRLERKSASQNAADLEHAFRNVESNKSTAAPAAAILLTGTLKVRSVDGLDGSNDNDRKIVVIATDDGETLVEALTNDPRLLQEGAAFAFELRELPTSLDPKKAGSGPEAEKPFIHPDAEKAIEGWKSKPAVIPESTKPAPDITGTTGSKGTNDATARATEPTGTPPNPEDPNLTGPSSDAGQATKGEMVQGQQTGGKSGKGTGKGESERGAAREAGKSDAAIETKDGLDPKALEK